MREIKLTVRGDTVHASRHRAGIQGEANATALVVSFDESWDGYAKKITFWDALEQNPVERTLTIDLLVDAANDVRTYKTTIPGEPLALAGECLLVIDGYVDGVRARAMSLRMTVEDAPMAEHAGEPSDPTPTQAEQLQVQIEALIGDIQTVAQGVVEVREIADHFDAVVEEATGTINNALSDANTAASRAKQSEENAAASELAASEHRTASEEAEKGAKAAEHGALAAAERAEDAASKEGAYAQQAGEFAQIAGASSEAAQNSAEQARVSAENAAASEQGVRDSANDAESAAKSAQESAQNASVSRQQSEDNKNAAESAEAGAKEAKNAAVAAAERAETAAAKEGAYAEQAKQYAQDADFLRFACAHSASDANVANKAAQEAATGANQSANSAAGSERGAANAAEQAGQAASNANTSATNAARSEQAAEEHKAGAAAAAALAEGYTSHPPIIGENGNWWEWDGKAYVDTGKPSQGEQGPKGDHGELTRAQGNTIYANALKGTASGETVRLDGVSPLEHTVPVKVSGADDTTVVKVQGKNLLKPSAYVKDCSNTAVDGDVFTTNFTNAGTFVNTGWTGKQVTHPKGTYTLSFVPVSDGACASVYVYAVEGSTDASTKRTIAFAYNVGKDGVDNLTFTANEDFFISLGGASKTSDRGTHSYKLQLELGTTSTAYEPYMEPVSYPVSEDGTCEVASIYPVTTLTTDTAGAIMDCEYNRDINKAFEQLTQAIISMGGNI